MSIWRCNLIMQFKMSKWIGLEVRNMEIEKWGFSILFVYANWIIRKMGNDSKILPRTRRGSAGFGLA